MEHSLRAPPPRILCLNVPPGLTDEKLASYYSQSRDADARVLRNTNAEEDSSSSDDDDDFDTDEDNILPYGKFTLVPDVATDHTPLYNKPAMDNSAPTNALLELYMKGRTPEEGLALVAGYLGEFMCALRALEKEVAMAGLFVLPATSKYAHARACGEHWYLAAPIATRTGFVMPERRSRLAKGFLEDSNADLGWSARTSLRGAEVTGTGTRLGLAQAVHTEAESEGDSSKIDEDDDESDSNLAIYEDDAPVTREPNRSFRDSELVQAVKDIKARQSDPQDAEVAIKQIDWHSRKKICHLHLCAFLFERLGNTNFQEIPKKLHKSRMRIVGWPELCDLPPDYHVGQYNTDKVKNMLLAIWRNQMKIEPWAEGERAESFPTLVIDSNGKRLDFPRHLLEDIRDDTPSDMAPTNGKPNSEAATDSSAASTQILVGMKRKAPPGPSVRTAVENSHMGAIRTQAAAKVPPLEEMNRGAKRPRLDTEAAVAMSQMRQTSTGKEKALPKPPTTLSKAKPPSKLMALVSAPTPDSRSVSLAPSVEKMGTRSTRRDNNTTRKSYLSKG